MCTAVIPNTLQRVCRSYVTPGYVTPGPTLRNSHGMDEDGALEAVFGVRGSSGAFLEASEGGNRASNPAHQHCESKRQAEETGRHSKRALRLQESIRIWKMVVKERLR